MINLLGQIMIILQISFNKYYQIDICQLNKQLTNKDMKIFVQTLTEFLTIIIERSDSIAVLKQKIEQKIHLSPTNQRLVFNKTILDDEKLLQDYQIHSQQTISLINISDQEITSYIDKMLVVIDMPEVGRKPIHSYNKKTLAKDMKQEKQQKLQAESREGPVRRGRHKKQPQKNEGLKGAQFCEMLKRKGVHDEILSILMRHEVESRQILKQCSEQMLILIGIPLAQVILLKKIKEL